MTDITVQQGQVIERILTLELVRVTERAAVASARLRGRGNEKAADQAAVDARGQSLRHARQHRRLMATRRNRRRTR